MSIILSKDGANRHGKVVLDDEEAKEECLVSDKSRQPAMDTINEVG